MVEYKIDLESVIKRQHNYQSLDKLSDIYKIDDYIYDPIKDYKLDSNLYDEKEELYSSINTNYFEDKY